MLQDLSPARALRPAPPGAARARLRCAWRVLGLTTGAYAYLMGPALRFLLAGGGGRLRRRALPALALHARPGAGAVGAARRGGGARAGEGRELPRAVLLRGAVRPEGGHGPAPPLFVHLTSLSPTQLVARARRRPAQPFLRGRAGGGDRGDHHRGLVRPRLAAGRGALGGGAQPQPRGWAW